MTVAQAQHSSASSPEESDGPVGADRKVLEFREQRNWAQFHSLRNLIVSLNLEASELLELTQWKSDADMAAMAASGEAQRSAARRMRRRAALPAADRRARRHRPRRSRTRQAAQERCAKYPVESSYGSSRKYLAEAGKG
jgi:hypothetical protein